MATLKDRFAHFEASQHGEAYGSFGERTKVSIDTLRRDEFARLDSSRIVYLDSAGASLYADSQLDAATAELRGAVLGNPHTQGPCSAATQARIDEVRARVLDFFGASRTHTCVFTAGATASLKLVAESFAWSRGRSELCYTFDCHNSVLGMREYAMSAGASFSCLAAEEVAQLQQRAMACEDPSLCADMDAGAAGGVCRGIKNGAGVDADQSDRKAVDACQPEVSNLFVLPAECNFSGTKHDLRIVRMVQQLGLRGDAELQTEDEVKTGISGTSEQTGQNLVRRSRWFVMLDAAKFAATNPLDLALYPADYTAVSFYKMFGWPTGLGALLVRKGAAERALCAKRYFGGGTVLAASAQDSFHIPRPEISNWLEDGTVDFLSIAAVLPGLRMLRELRMERIQLHVHSLTRHLALRLGALRHGNIQASSGHAEGAPVCELYGNHAVGDVEVQGPVVAFNLLRADGSYVGYSEIERLATVHAIQLRTGCFCNPGACAHYLRLAPEDLKAAREAGHVCWDDNDLIQGRPTGAVRVSIGYMNTFEDVEAFMHLIETHFVEGHVVQPLALQMPPSRLGAALCAPHTDTTVAHPRVRAIQVFPIKSCAPMRVQRWPLLPNGLAYDRQWSVVDSNGVALTQRRAPQMCKIRAVVDLDAGLLRLEAPGRPDLTMALDIEEGSGVTRGANIAVCSTKPRQAAQEAEQRASKWLSEFLGVPCTLVRAAGQGVASFANVGQLLVLSTASVDLLNTKLDVAVSAETFRPNLVLEGVSQPHEEDSWVSFRVGEHALRVTSQCSRCTMVNINQRSGVQLREPLLTMASYRRQLPGRQPRGIVFGVYCSVVRGTPGEGGDMQAEGRWLSVGDVLSNIITETRDTAMVVAANGEA